MLTGAINSLVQEKKIDLYPPIFVGEEFLKLIDDIEHQEYSGEQYTLPYVKVRPLHIPPEIVFTKVFVCKHFSVVLSEDKYMFFNEDGLKTAEKTHDEIGDVISKWEEDNFVTRIGDDRLQFDGNGELEDRRPLTDEEKSMLKTAG